MTRNKPWLEARVDEAMRVLLSKLPEDDTPDRDLEEAQGRAAELSEAIEHLEQLIRDTQRRMTDGEVYAEDGWPMISEWRANINTARHQLGRLAIHKAKKEEAALQPGDALLVWTNPKTTFDVRRQILEGHISRIVVKPLGRGGSWGANREVPVDSIEILPL